MSVLKVFTIPLLGLKIGMHEFDFEVSSDFFAEFEGSPISEANFEVKLYLDKRPDEMLVLVFTFQGTTAAECDRCLRFDFLPVLVRVEDRWRVDFWDRFASFLV